MSSRSSHSNSGGQVYGPNHPRNIQPTGGRSESRADEDRPFAEIRKTLHDILRMLSLHRWAFLVPCCLVSSALFVGSLYYPRTYKASLTFERRNHPIVVNLTTSARTPGFDYFRETIGRDLKNTEHMVRVVDDLGMSQDLERDETGAFTPDALKSRAAMGRGLASVLSVYTRPSSNNVDIVDLSYTGPDPTLGRKLVEAVRREYVRATDEWMQKFLNEQRDIYIEMEQEAMGELNAAQRVETKLRLENPHLNPQNPGALSLRMSQLQLEKRELSLRRREYLAELTAQRQMLAAIRPPATPAADQSLDEPVDYIPILSQAALELSAAMQAIDKEIAELRSTRGMTDQHPTISDLLARRHRFEEQFQKQVALDRSGATRTAGAQSGSLAAPAQVVQPWESERAKLLIQIAAQESKLKELEIDLQGNESALVELRKAKGDIYRLQDEFEEASINVQKARQRLNDSTNVIAKIDPAITLIERGLLLTFNGPKQASGSFIPISPKAMVIVMLSILAGVGVGVACVILAEVVDHMYRSSSQVGRSLGLPILEAIDEIITTQDRRRFMIQRVAVVPMILVLCIGATGLTGSMAYLSIQQPWTYEKLRQIPEAALKLIVEEQEIDPVVLAPKDKPSPDPTPKAQGA